MFAFEVPVDGGRSGVGAGSGQLLAELDDACPDGVGGGAGVGFRGAGAGCEAVGSGVVVAGEEGVDPLAGDSEMGCCFGGGETLF